MRYTLSLEHYPHYEGLEYDADPSDAITVISESLFDYMIKEQFKLPEELINDMLYCKPKLKELSDFRNFLLQSEQDSATRHMLHFVSVEIDELKDDVMSLNSQLTQKCDEFCEELRQPGVILPNILGAVTRHHFGNPPEEPPSQPMRVKPRPTKASLLQELNFRKSKLRNETFQMTSEDSDGTTKPDSTS